MKLGIAHFIVFLRVFNEISSTSTSVTVGWEHPTTNGGSPVTGYRLYMDDGAGGDYFMIGSTL